MSVTTDTDRHYAMGIMAAKRAMSDGNVFSAMCNQAEEVLTKPSLEEMADQRNLLILALLAARDELRRNDAFQAAKEADEVLERCKVRK